MLRKTVQSRAAAIAAAAMLATSCATTGDYDNSRDDRGPIETYREEGLPIWQQVLIGVAAVAIGLVIFEALDVTPDAPEPE